MDFRIREAVDATGITNVDVNGQVDVFLLVSRSEREAQQDRNTFI